MKDPIVEEVRRIREAHAAKYDFDIKRIMEESRRREPTWGNKIAPQRRTNRNSRPSNDML